MFASECEDSERERGGECVERMLCSLVCVSERERERERESYNVYVCLRIAFSLSLSHSLTDTFSLSIMLSHSPTCGITGTHRDPARFVSKFHSSV